jgi:hypothetical protein
MPFKTFKKIFKSLPRSVTQIAFGVDAQCKTNPDTFRIFEYCRSHGVIPNVTVADVTVETARKLAKCCGAVAVSRYENKDICYNSVQKLVKAGCKQVNIHAMVSVETYEQVLETLKDYLADKRLEKLNAIVLLSLKQKGRGVNYHSLSFSKFKELVSFAFDRNIPIGFDSCSYHKFVKVIGAKKRKKIDKFCEPCESGLFSMYCNSAGQFFPCSFMEGKDDWVTGLDLVNIKNFYKEIWNNKKVVQWRKRLLANQRACPCYKI